MASIKTRIVDKNLQKKGFKKEEGDHHFYTFYYNGKKTQIRTKMSHSHSEISDPLIRCMAKDLKLDTKDFRQFANCTISEVEYIKIQRKNKNI